MRQILCWPSKQHIGVQSPKPNFTAKKDNGKPLNFGRLSAIVPHRIIWGQTVDIITPLLPSCVQRLVVSALGLPINHSRDSRHISMVMRNHSYYKNMHTISIGYLQNCLVYQVCVWHVYPYCEMLIARDQSNHPTN